jgi:SAM-dependent methyltransferase
MQTSALNIARRIVKLLIPPIGIILVRWLALHSSRMIINRGSKGLKTPPANLDNIYLYFGSMHKHEPQYSNPRFICLALEPKSEKEIRHDAYDELSFPENSISKIQSQDVFEHLEYEKIPFVLDEIFRVLKPGGVFRLSMPDYNSPAMRKECVFDENGEIMVDISCGGSVIYDRNIPGKRAVFINTGDAHLWFPTYEKTKLLISKSNIRGSTDIIFRQHWINQESFISDNIPDEEMFVQRAPPHDMRAGGKPVSIVVDFVK